jgi:folate-binding protein YgfZ
MPEISLIRITGPDASTFLQGQLTNDVARLETEEEILAAWCNPKGRVICVGPLRRIEDGYEFRVAAELAEDVVRRLTMFRFRSKVSFEIVADAETVDSGLLVASGLPFVGRPQSEQFTPHMLNLDLLDAISFDKGCYTGQEVVARTHYKGATKRRALRFESDVPLQPGDKVVHDEREIGTVLNVADRQLLAVVPVDKSEALLTVKGNAIRPLPLSYLQDAP